MVVLLIALVPALVVFAFVVASPKKSTLFWAPFWGLAVGMLGGPAFFLMDAGAVLLAAFLGWLVRGKADSSGYGYVDEKWVAPGSEDGSSAPLVSTYAEHKKRREDALIQAVIDQENERGRLALERRFEEIDREFEQSGYSSRAEYLLAKRKALLAGIPLSQISKKKADERTET